MRWMALAMAGVVFSSATAEAAYQSMPVRVKQRVIEGSRERWEVSRPQMAFRMEIVSDDEGLKQEVQKGNRSAVIARRDERYAVRLYNPLPVRVAVNLTIDGLNAISGKPSGIRDGQKWIIDPYSTITLRGWQVNGQEARRFFFTDKPKSYADWQGERMKLDLSANCGVIGAAFFWSQKELDQYYHSRPVYRPQPFAAKGIHSDKVANLEMGASRGPEIAAHDGLARRAAPEAEAQQAGTGMGEREINPIIEVAFNYDTGMKSPKDALVLYYDFENTAEPNPFPALSFAPEMP